MAVWTYAHMPIRPEADMPMCSLLYPLYRSPKRVSPCKEAQYRILYVGVPTVGIWSYGPLGSGFQAFRLTIPYGHMAVCPYTHMATCPYADRPICPYTPSAQFHMPRGPSTHLPILDMGTGHMGRIACRHMGIWPYG